VNTFFKKLTKAEIFLSFYVFNYNRTKGTIVTGFHDQQLSWCFLICLNNLFISFEQNASLFLLPDTTKSSDLNIINVFWENLCNA